MPYAETVIVAIALLVGLLVGWLLQRQAVVVLRGLLNDSERRSEAHQRLVVEVSRELCRMEHLEDPLRAEKPDDDDHTSDGCGGGDDERAKAYARECADAESTDNESFAETIMAYNALENFG